MKISLVIACFNEGPDLEATVALAAASKPELHEIIVVDDCSDKEFSVLNRMLSFPDVRVIRTPERLGAGPAKRFGGQYATGDAIVLSDSHMRFPWDWVATAEKSMATYPNAIWCCVSRGFETDSQFCGCGGTLTYDKLGLEFGWREPTHPQVADHTPCLLGGFYFIPKKIWDALDGLNPNFHGWGYEEADLSIRAWLYGFEVRRMNNLVVKHNYNRNLKGNFLNSWQSGFNSLVCHATLFEDGVWQEIRPYMFRMVAEEAIARFEKKESEIMAFREKVQKSRNMSDKDVQAFTKFPTPTAGLMETLLLEHEQRLGEQRLANYESMKSGKDAEQEV